MPSLVDRQARIRLCTDALLLGVALMLSYLEAVLPINPLLPLPGFRMGLAQLAVTLTFFRIGRADAAAVSFVRVLIMGVLFGSVTTLYFSACGALLSYWGLLVGEKLMSRRCSYIGLGVLCAALHNIGQLIAAATLFGTALFVSYLPVLLLASALFGTLGGLLLNLTVPRLAHTVMRGAFCREKKH